MTKKTNARLRAEDAFRRFEPNSAASADAHGFYICARSNFYSLLNSLSAEELMALKYMLDSLCDSTRA